MMHAAHVVDAVSDNELAEIERRASAALAVAPAPWQAFLETRRPIGGSTFIRIGDPHEPADREMYLHVHDDGHTWTSPDPRLDAVVDFIAHAAQDIPTLLGEINRLRKRLG